MVIPHGTTWGIHAPADSSLSLQLTNKLHDPKRQRLIEVYSGHGNSEIYKDFKHAVKLDDGLMLVLILKMILNLVVGGLVKLSDKGVKMKMQSLVWLILKKLRKILLMMFLDS